MTIKTRALCSASILATLLAAPAFAQTTPPAAPQTTDDAAVVDEVVVTGFRRSLQSAQAIKRNSDSIVDAIVAEDIGKLPDVTASESLARVTGVQVTRSAGEAAQVAVRGLLDVSTTYNGREIFTAQDRLVAIQDFGAGTVAALEVYKSGTANLVEPGIGGLINVRSRKPFDFAGREISGSVNAVYWEQAEEPSWNGNLLLSDRWDTGAGEMGLLVNVAYSSVDYLDSTREQALFIAASSPGESPLPSFRFPDSVQQFQGRGTRSRPTANVAFQWRPTEQLEVYIDALYQGYRGRDGDIWNYNPLWGGATFTDVVLRPGSNDAMSLTAQQGPGRVSDGYKTSLDRDTDTWQIGGGLVWTGERLKVSADLATTDSTVTDEKVNLDYAYTGPVTLRVNFDGSGEHGGPSFDLVNYDASNPANVLYRGLFEERARNEGQDVQFRTDFDYEAGWGPITSIQGGLRATDRDARRQYANRYAPGLGLGLNMSQLGLELEVVRGFAFDDGHSFGGIVLPTRDSIMDNVAGLRTIAGQPAGNVPFPTRPELDANEKTFAGYL
ncbi:MAG TPA: TonB-dependent receptor plug domain-containing protein, partial [Brevundimonas sp.]